MLLKKFLMVVVGVGVTFKGISDYIIKKDKYPLEDSLVV